MSYRRSSEIDLDRLRAFDDARHVLFALLNPSKETGTARILERRHECDQAEAVILAPALATFRRKISDFWIVADEVRKARPAALAAGVI